MTELRVVLTTVPDADVAASIAKHVVEGGLAACVNILPGVRSIYRWKGAIEDDSEVLMIAKVRSDRLAEFEARVVELHPYDVPEVVALKADRVFEPYLRWALGSEPG